MIHGKQKIGVFKIFVICHPGGPPGGNIPCQSSFFHPWVRRVPMMLPNCSGRITGDFIFQ
jgi:hypothetical protein